MVDLLLDHGVDLLLTGHSHAPYPAELTRNSDGKRLKILSMPCAHAPRKLFSKPTVAPRVFAVLNVSAENAITLSVHDFADGKAIPSSYFPASIPLGDPKVKYERMNLARKP